MPYYPNGEAYDRLEDAQEAEWIKTLAKAIAVVLACALAICLAGKLAGDGTQDVEPGTLSIETSNAAAMHEYGMPTKEDCIEYHLHGQWGYYKGNVLYAFDELPGGSEAWDDLYGIENGNAFHY